MKKENKKSLNCQNLNLGAETAFPHASKFKNFILLQLVFELELLKPPIGVSVFWFGSLYHVTNCPQNLLKS